jgi:Spy/CpxP family protein refolding chaperone
MSLKTLAIATALVCALAPALAAASTPNGQKGYEGQPGNNGGNGQQGYEGQPGNQGG